MTGIQFPTWVTNPLAHTRHRDHLIAALGTRARVAALTSMAILGLTSSILLTTVR